MRVVTLNFRSQFVFRRIKLKIRLKVKSRQNSKCVPNQTQKHKAQNRVIEFQLDNIFKKIHTKIFIQMAPPRKSRFSTIVQGIHEQSDKFRNFSAGVHYARLPHVRTRRSVFQNVRSVALQQQKWQQCYALASNVFLAFCRKITVTLSGAS